MEESHRSQPGAPATTIAPTVRGLERTGGPPTTLRPERLYPDAIPVNRRCSVFRGQRGERPPGRFRQHLYGAPVGNGDDVVRRAAIFRLRGRFENLFRIPKKSVNASLFGKGRRDFGAIFWLL